MSDIIEFQNDQHLAAAAELDAPQPDQDVNQWANLAGPLKVSNSFTVYHGGHILTDSTQPQWSSVYTPLLPPLTTARRS